MTIGLWIKSGSGVADLKLSPVYEGVSALRMYGSSISDPIKLERKYFACQSFRVTFQSFIPYWNRKKFKVIADEYGTFPTTDQQPNSGWYKRRASFLWDRTTESKWFRLEKWDGVSWSFVHADISLGAEAPGLSKFYMSVESDRYEDRIHIDDMLCEVIA